MSDRLIISVRPGETRGALIRNGRMVWYDFIRTLHESEQPPPPGTIFLARVRKVEPGLQAAFVEPGSGNPALLAAKDARILASDTGATPPIEKLVHEGQSVLVQISRPGREGKGPRVTADLTLPGPEGKSVRPLRGEDSPLWPEIRERAKTARAPALIWQPPAPDPAVALWNRAPAKAASIEVDHNPSAAALRRALAVSGVEVRIESRREDVFSAHDLEEAVDGLLASVAPLPGGGSLAIDMVTALTAIDVNARGALGSTGEDTALRVNLEAAAEIPRQIALRRLGGIVVIDFLRLKAARHRRQVIARLRGELEAFGLDVPVGGFSPAGLVELVVPRRAAPLHERLTARCPNCNGTGSVPDVAGHALSLLARIADESRQGGARLEARAAPQVIDWLESRSGEVARELERFAVTAISWKTEPAWPPGRMDVRRTPA